MKKVLVVLCAWALFLGMVGNSNALTYTEEYNGSQAVYENSSFNFGFDFWYNNSVYGVGTDSSLTLTQDAAGAFGPWESASLYIDFYSTDWAYEYAGVKLTAWKENGDPNQTFDLGTFSFNAYYPWHEIVTFTHDFTSAQLAVFDDWGWGNVQIKAVTTGSWHDNNFAVNTVGMTVDTASVPEPATLLLLGTGLVGLGFFSRRKFKK
jgi:hypothetical protein